jgi:NTP pyrophosphatase (non-canonical NTP hydrolase)
MARSIFGETLNTWGLETQISTAMEECGELIAALSQYFFRKRITKEMLAAEVADVEIICEQLRFIIGDDIVDEQKAAKLMRLREVIDTHCKHSE